MRTAAIAAVALFAAVAHGHCRGLDRTALIRLYEAFDGANWANNRNWNTSSGTSAQNKANDPCDHNNRWYGVGFIDPCEKYLDDIIGDGPQTDFLTRVRGSGQGCFAGRITSLLLRRNNLRGNLTVPELGDLANLTYIDLSWNGLEGAIPTEIGRLNNVQIINLAHNNITGELPTELGNINSMGPSAYKGPTGRLTGGCGNDDPCPLGTQLKLTDLSLHHNMITGTLAFITHLFFTAFLPPLLSLAPLLSLFSFLSPLQARSRPRSASWSTSSSSISATTTSPAPYPPRSGSSTSCRSSTCARTYCRAPSLPAFFTT